MLSTMQPKYGLKTLTANLSVSGIRRQCALERPFVTMLSDLHMG
jgi:hypothetical protein